MPRVKVGYAIWNRRHLFESGIKEILVDLDFALDSIIVPFVHQDCNAILDYMADSTDFTHAVVYASGTGIRRNYALDTRWHEHCRDTWMVSGHILARPNDGYAHLHEQSFAINLDLWKNCGRPQIGYRENVSKKLKPYQQSQENIHDDYTPIWLEPIDGKPLIVDKPKFGWNIISSSLAHGLRVVNIPIDIRKQKFYIYPDDNNQKLVSAVAQVRANRLAVTDTFENQSQGEFVEWLRDRLTRANSPVFLFNTGLLWWPSQQEQQPDSIWTSASGFKSFIEWHTRGASPHCRIHTYDYNQRSLSVWRHIHGHWQGFDLYGFMRDYDRRYEIEEIYCWGNKLSHESVKEASDRQELELLEFFDSREHMIAQWKIFQGLMHRYHYCNLVTEHQKLLRYLEPKKTHLIWINNIFFFRQNIIQYGLNNLNDRLCDFVNSISVQAPNTYVFGQCSKLYFGHRVDYISAEIAKVPDHRHQWDMDNDL